VSEETAQNEVQDVPASEEAQIEAVPQKKPSKIERKRQQIFQERMQRHLNQGKTSEQAFAALQKEDYERLPVDAKVKRLEGILLGTLQRLANDISALRTNQTYLADAMNVNFKGFEKMLRHLGVDDATQKKFMAEAEAELKAEWEAREAARAAAAKQAQEEATKQEIAETVDEPAPAGQVAPVPEGATVFGG
jgi:hypothetical protein